MSKVFEQLIEFLSDAGVSPDRVGQIETEYGCTYEDSAPISYQDEGRRVLIYPDGTIWENGQLVAQMEQKEDAWYQGQDMVAVLAL